MLLGALLHSSLLSLARASTCSGEVKRQLMVTGEGWSNDTISTTTKERSKGIKVQPRVDQGLIHTEAELVFSYGVVDEKYESE